MEKYMSPEEAMERPGQFSSEFIKEANRPYISVFSRIPPEDPWAKFGLAMDGLGCVLDEYMRKRDSVADPELYEASAEFTVRAYALLSLVLNSVQRITANLSSELVHHDAEKEEDFRVRRWMALRSSSPLEGGWEPVRYARLIYPFVREMHDGLATCSRDAGMDAVIRLAVHETRIIWTMADMMAAYEILR